MDVSSAIETVRKNRAADLDRGRAVYERALSDPAFYAAEKAVRGAAIDLARGKIKKADLDKAKAERKNALDRLGLSETDFVPPPRCKTCGDTGLCDGKPCRCAVDLSIKSADTVELPKYTFDELDTAAVAGTQTEKTARILKAMCDKFPASNKRNFVLMGSTGVGKTFLAGCVADAVRKKGYSVVAVSAFSFVNKMLAYHTTFNDSKLSILTPFLECDLLIIDDLGTESILKNVTLEYLYLVVNERNNAGRHTLVTTNLNMDALSARYGDRIVSRLFDKRICYTVGLTGKDLRKIDL
ncbi:MAG: ATP-binding protein [Clostridia bacterium]|nr:ATP-binding protein [Clostridia bacterium]